MKNFRKTLFSVIIACLLFITAHSEASNSTAISSEQIIEDANYEHILNLLLAAPECTEMNDAEMEQANQALNVLKTFPAISKMHIAATYYFSENQYRRINEKPAILCVPAKIKSEAISELIKEGLFSKRIIEPNLARFAFMLDGSNLEIVTAIGNTAFYHEAIGSSVGDTRPIARLVLSKFGSEAAQWSEQAVTEISSNDKLGTSAAAVAAATGNLAGIERISTLIAEILSENGQKAIKKQDTDRLFQLVVAMALAGNKAQPYVDPLITLSGRKIESWAPPFGIIEVSPQYVCAALKKIGGKKAETVLRTDLCVPKK